MKKIILFWCLLLTFLLSQAAINEKLLYYSSDFSNPTEQLPLCGWTSFGNSAAVAEVTLGTTDALLKDYFPQGCASYQLLNFKGYGNVPWSNSSFADGSSADQWLVSPMIDLDGSAENVMLDFDVLCFGSSNESKYEVYVSETGNAREDFTGKPVYSGRLKGSAKEIIKTRIHKALKEIGGKKIWLAFVNKSTDSQLTGFDHITLSEYDIDLINNTPSFTTESGSFEVSVEVSLMTPLSCKGFVATLTGKNGDIQEYRSDKQLSSRYNTYSFSFPEPISVSYGEVYDYTLTLTPNYEGATPTEMACRLVCQEGYPATCVMEEGTGTWCGYCVRGTAALSYYADLYGDRFIGIAVHNDDPMEVYDYISNWKEQAGLNTFPSAWINRSIATDPAMGYPVIEAEAMKRVGQKITIDEVDFDIESLTATVKYSPEFCSDMTDVDVTAVAIVTEDNCLGKGSSWMQNNYYSGATLDSWLNEGLPEAMWEYVYDYTLEKSLIPSQKYGFNHVAMGVYNNYYGNNTTLSTEWLGGVPQQYTLTFDFPMQETENGAGVQDWHNTAITVLLLDRATGKILNADRMYASSYTTEEAGIMMVPTGIEIKVLSDGIYVKGEEKASVEIYNMQGLLLQSVDISPEGGKISMDSTEGMVCARIVSGNTTVIKKLLFGSSK